MYGVFLVRRYEESMGRKKVLEDELNDLEGKLLRAEKLVTGTHRVSLCLGADSTTCKRHHSFSRTLRAWQHVGCLCQSAALLAAVGC